MAVIALGTFDGVHAGHVALLRTTREVAAQRNETALIHTFANHPRGVFAQAPRLLMRDGARLAALRAQGLEVVADAFTADYAALSPRDFVAMLRARFAMRAVVTGYNYTFGKNGAGDVATLAALGAEWGFDVITVPPCLYEGVPISSTRIRSCIEKGRMEEANAMLQRTYCMRGEVQSGRRIGRTLGFPTANIACDAQLVLPKVGVYATHASLAGATHPAITNVGSNPTLGGGDTRVETHLLDFDGDFYGRTMDVHFMAFMREETRFANTDALRAQLARDADSARSILQNLPIYKDFFA
ncbi:MAG: bifunctional riboflavin kinase/FAD synthetase [Clostridia bacterium]|nr:bifunctional riboflavin kinase/FAD synthetase [Clostridia bacterium]